MEALLEYGGIYLDLDVFTLRSYAPLMHFEIVLGIEGGVGWLPRQGLCNALMIARPHAPFLERWYTTYKTFEDKDWSKHSVKKPLRLALDHPEELLVMDPYAFFYPLWDNTGLNMVHSR